MVIIKDGNLLKADDVDIIAHQVNCQGTYGAGIAKQIANKFPKAKENYLRMCKATNTEYLLGRVHTSSELTPIIADLFGQEYYGKYGQYYKEHGRQTNYKKLKSAMTELRKRFPDKVVGMPYGIGCGLAGGDWDVVYNIIKEVFNGHKVILYKYKG